MSLSQTNHGTGLQRAVLAPSLQNTWGSFVARFSPPPKATNYEAEQGATDNTTD